MGFWAVETVSGSSSARPGLRFRSSGCSDAIECVLENEPPLEVNDGTEDVEYGLASGG